tara:strand:- start:1 stop:171 length:171 start_codon:yes stop_codon:yes gene_type:complete
MHSYKPFSFSSCSVIEGVSLRFLDANVRFQPKVGKNISPEAQKRQKQLRKYVLLPT